jgi:hypothetical protein
MEILKRLPRAGKRSRATAAGTKKTSVLETGVLFRNLRSIAEKGANMESVARYISPLPGFNIRSMTNEIQQSGARSEMGL